MNPEISSTAGGTLPAVSIYELVLNADIVVQTVMALLVLLSLVCWAIILEKSIRLSGFARQVSRLERSVTSLDGSPAASAWFARSIYAAGAEYAEDIAAATRSEQQAGIEKAMRSRARATLSRLQRRVRFLATVGSTAPFIGLFGTVWGIMNSFTAIAAQKDTSLAVVAPGIAEALFATALGLVAAIPAVFAYNQLAGSYSRMSERTNLAISDLSALLARNPPLRRPAHGG
jgi:biopolymer transport protein ExbB/TolQ